MIEIVFSESACGTLKIAQSYGKGPYQGGAVGVFVHHADGRPATPEEIAAAQQAAREKARLAWEAAEPMGGSARDVYCIDLNLSEGDISEDFSGNLRGAEMLEKLRRLGDVHSADILPERLRAAQAALDMARSTLAGDGEIRVWYSLHNPDEYCGFCWLMARLQDIPAGQVHAVCLPTCVEEENTIVQYGSWGDVELERWHGFVRYARTLPPVQRRAYAACWRELRAENAALRAIVNGRLVSVPGDFYDGFIRREIGLQEEEFHEARVIGNIIGRYGLGLGDGFIALRIEEMIARGELEAVTKPGEGEIIYRRRIRKTEKFRAGC